MGRELKFSPSRLVACSSGHNAALLIGRLSGGGKLRGRSAVTAKYFSCYSLPLTVFVLTIEVIPL
jgi:hypothetical protein